MNLLIPLGITLTLAATDPSPPPSAIVVCAQRYPIGSPVVTWLDPGGYDATNLDRRFPEDAPPNAPTRVKPGFGERDRSRLRDDLRRRVDREGWDLPALQAVVDQFVIHYDEAGTSRACFRILHDERDLGVHFLLDLDGTLYQTMDLERAAWHATRANQRSIGIEIANLGAFSHEILEARADRWYRPDESGKLRLIPPMGSERSGLRNPSLILRSNRSDPIRGEVQGQTLEQYDFTPQQYHSLIELTQRLLTLFPRITPDYPRGQDGQLRTTALTADEFRDYAGLLGHFHVQANKVDPGPAFLWDDLIKGLRDPSPAP